MSADDTRRLSIVKPDQVAIDLSAYEEQKSPAPPLPSHPVAPEQNLVIRHDGQRYEVASIHGWAKEKEEFSPERRARLDLAVAEGEILGLDGKPLTGRVLQRVRDRLLGTYDGLPKATLASDRRAPAERRMLIPGLWPWDTIPMFGGNPKAGKTTLAVDLVHSLVVPGHRFLSHFGAVELTEDELGRGVWLINAETPREDLEQVLLPALDVGVVGGHSALDAVTVAHLEDMGGAQSFDLTDPATYERWAHELVDCWECEGLDDWTPVVVIVDGLTAILHAAGKGIEEYGQWYAAFRRLMHELDVPNALVVAHNTLAGGHLMGGVEAQAGADALWVYSSDNPDNPTSTRRFSVVPRLGGVPIPPMEVRLHEGRPVVWSAIERGSTQPAAAASPSLGRVEFDSGPAYDPASTRLAVLADLTQAGVAGLKKTQVTGSGDAGQFRRAALDELLDEGLVIFRRDGKGQRWWASASAPTPP
jgi:AAA domain